MIKGVVKTKTWPRPPSDGLEIDDFLNTGGVSNTATRERPFAINGFKDHANLLQLESISDQFTRNFLHISSYILKV